MAIRRLPAVPNLENLKNQAKSLLSAVRDAEPSAVAAFTEFHPRTVAPAAARLTDAQLVLARSYGQASWQGLAGVVQEQLDLPKAGGSDNFPLDRAVNRRNVRNFLRAHAPEIALDRLELISALHGDSLEFTYGDKRLKVPKSGRAALLKEAALFEYIRQQALPVQLPQVEFLHERGLYAIYSQVEAPRLSAEALQAMTATQLAEFIELLAQFLSALHRHDFPDDMLALVPRGDDPFEEQAKRVRQRIEWIEAQTTRFGTARWMAELDRVEGALNQRWRVSHCDPQLFRFYLTGQGSGRGSAQGLGVTDLHDALLQDPAVDLGDFLADASRDLPADGVLAHRLRQLLLDAYVTDDPDLAGKVDFILMGSQVRWARIEVRAGLKATKA